MKTKDGRFFLTPICFVGGSYFICINYVYWCPIRFSRSDDIGVV